MFLYARASNFFFGRTENGEIGSYDE